MEKQKLIEMCQQSINDINKHWVLFEYGTCVIVMQPQGKTEWELEAQAKALLSEFGPVHVGTPSGDFRTVVLDNDLGWVVTCHHPDILTFVGLEDGEDNQLTLGLMGRSWRDLDSKELQVIAVCNPSASS